jgi:signal peptidase I
MKRLVQDRCRDLARTPGRLPRLRFAVHLMADSLRTTVREQAAAFRSAGRKQSARNWVTEWTGTILMYLFVTTTLVQAYVVPTASMDGTLCVGDHMLVDRVAYAGPGPFGRHILPYREIQNGDIVAFLYPEDVRVTYVKRVIGVPGDRIHLENGQAVRNARRLIEPYVQHVAAYPDRYRDDFPLAPEAYTTPRGRDMFEHHIRNGEVIVPPGMLFVMGDNRDNSADSRYWGFVPRGHVVGKPVFVYWSFDAPTADLEGWSVAHVLDVAAHFFTRTRWNRTFLVPRSQRAKEIGGGRDERRSARRFRVAPPGRRVRPAAPLRAVRALCAAGFGHIRSRSGARRRIRMASAG